MKFARILFRIAALWGFAVLTPLYFLYENIGREYPPAITHPDFYYGFIGVGLAWQAAFLVISSDPSRFRPMMVPAMLEKFIFVISLGALYAHGRLQVGQLMVVGPDLILGILFIAAFLKTPTRDMLARAKS